MRADVLFLSVFLSVAPVWAQSGVSPPLSTAASDSVGTGAAPVSDWADVETVVVHAHAPGPLLWRVSKGEAEVWIIGTLSPLPQDFAWNKTVIAEKITGAKTLYLPARATTSLLGMGWYFLTHWGALAMPDGQKVQDLLDAEWQTRLAAAVSKAHLPPDRYDTRNPFVAAMMLRSDYVKSRQWQGEAISAQLAAIAKDRKVPVTPLAEYDASPLVKEILAKPPAAGVRCLKAAIKDVENLDRHGIAAADAWAEGNMAGIKAHYVSQGAEECIAAQSTVVTTLEARFAVDATRAIDRALSTPGKTVMMADVGRLLRREGLFAALTARGIRVEQIEP